MYGYFYAYQVKYPANFASYLLEDYQLQPLKAKRAVDRNQEGASTIAGLEWWTGPVEWTGLDWTGLDWTGLDWTEECQYSKSSSCGVLWFWNGYAMHAQ